jgi:putative addiction module component (TIGR02574 family)
LSEVEKIRILEFIFDSLDKPDADVETKWVNESEKRYQAYKEGKIHGISIN